MRTSLQGFSKEKVLLWCGESIGCEVDRVLDTEVL